MCVLCVSNGSLSTLFCVIFQNNDAENTMKVVKLNMSVL